jgi:hypothetical protein
MNVLRALGALLGGTAAVFAAAIPIDLTSWQERGPAANGNWTVAGGGTSVFQSINGNPTFFVSPTNYLNTTLRGTIKVETASDNDLVGFVLGFNGPASTGTDMDFVLFDWRQGTQGGSQEGFALSRVNGNITNFAPSTSPFWVRGDTTGFDNLANDYSATRGWVDNIEYSFEILYQSDRIRVFISGGAFGAGETIFDVAGSFPSGAFGFYNYSQASVRYAGLTEEDTPTGGGGSPVPEPSTLALTASCAAALAAIRFRRG